MLTVKYQTVDEELLDRTLDACIRALTEEPLPRMEAISRVRNDMGVDFATTEKYMLKLVEEGLVRFKDERYSLG